MKMMKTAKTVLSLILLTALCLSAFCACSEKKPELSDAGILHDDKFGGVYIDCSIDGFNALGFEFGDSVDVVFSNGKNYKGIPYYNGYYVDIGEPLLIGYPGASYIEVKINYGDDPYLLFGLDESCRATVTLDKKAKFLDVQNACSISYSDEQGSQSDAEFGNFRAVSVGNIKEKVLYRSASPCNDKHKRAGVVDRLAADAGIGFMLNLSENEDDLKAMVASEGFSFGHFLSLYNGGKVAALGLSANFKSEDFSAKLAAGLTKMSENDGPYLVHCVEGKDRTGYVMMLLEALCGASVDEIVDDYMLTYDNYYGINKESDPARYKTIREKNLDLMLAYMTGADSGFESLDLASAARALLVKIGMTESAVDALKSRLTGT